MMKKLPDNLQGKSIKSFLRGFHSDATKESYCKKLAHFIEFSKITPDKFLQTATKNPKAVQHMMIDYIENRKSKVSGSTLNQSKAALKHFFEMNDVDDGINWSKISKMIPRSKRTGSDRAPTTEEIRYMMDSADIRIKCVILTCASSGIRVGAFEGMVWGDVYPISNDDDNDNNNNKEIVAAKLIVYRGDVEEYITFVTPECYSVLLQYKSLREAIGEKVTSSSPLIRDSWDNHRYRKNKTKDPKIAKSVTSKTIANMMGEFLKKINMREENHTKNSGYEFKQVHGFRKYFKTNAERACKTIDVEKLMGHAENYYKPSETHLLEEYLKAVPYLSISETADLKNKLGKQMVQSDKKVGEIERENIDLQDRLTKLEGSYGSLKEILENVLLARTK